MTETFPNPLLDVHRQAEAEFQPFGPVEIVSTFGEPQAEYAAIRKSAGLMDLPQRGVLEFTGKDRLSFLNNFLTNQTWDKQTKSDMPAGSAVYAFLLNSKGRVVADMNVLELGESTWLEMDVRLVETVRQLLDKYVFTEKVKVASKVGRVHEIVLHGPGAAGVLGVTLPEPMRVARARLFETDVVVWRDDPCAVPGYHVLMPSESARAVWLQLLGGFSVTSAIGKRSLRPVGWAAFNATRIEGGRSILGVDYDDTILPAETGQFERAVSVTKGCYLGQEIVARMYARAQVARKIIGIRMEDDGQPIAGAPVVDPADNQIGAVTSSTISPVLSNAAVCLGILKKPFFEEGTEVRVPAEGRFRKGRVTKVPFV